MPGPWLRHVAHSVPPVERRHIDPDLSAQEDELRAMAMAMSGAGRGRIQGDRHFSARVGRFRAVPVDYVARSGRPFTFSIGPEQPGPGKLARVTVEFVRQANADGLRVVGLGPGSAGRIRAGS